MNKPIIKPKILVEFKSETCRGVNRQGGDVFNREKDIKVRTYDNGAIIPTCPHFGSSENPRGCSSGYQCKYHSQGA